MGTIIDYIKEYGKYTFQEKPFNEVDSLVLSQFSYLKFDGLVPAIEIEEKTKPEKGKTGKEKSETGKMVDIKFLHEHEDYDNLYADERYREDNTKLFLAMVNSRRFGTLKMNNYVNYIDIEEETQFSAITLQMEDGTFYVVYRGTDETIIGWKEDLNLAFSEPVPAQVMSVEYLNCTAKQIREPFYVGGHSKGGNLAIYAAMNCEQKIQDRIKAIYSHDGPGFRPEVMEECGYDKIESRVHRTIPHSSLVGLILYSKGTYRVVESKSIGLAQHNPYSWLVHGDDFKIVKHVYSGRMFMDDALNEWILSLNQEQMRVFVDTLFDVVMASEADNLIDFTANWKKSIQGILSATKNVDAETMKVINKIMKALFEMISQHAKEELQNRAEIQKSKIDEGISHLEQMFKK
ncbi:MAG: DUF2974 domain-containing protein [Lachnospiraceae bacterium]|nr:DUF2974 domain-containing protein [Lachnospiraceae bacterium]